MVNHQIYLPISKKLWWFFYYYSMVQPMVLQLVIFFFSDLFCILFFSRSFQNLISKLLLSIFFFTTYYTLYFIEWHLSFKFLIATLRLSFAFLTACGIVFLSTLNSFNTVTKIILWEFNEFLVYCESLSCLMFTYRACWSSIYLPHFVCCADVESLRVDLLRVSEGLE